MPADNFCLQEYRYNNIVRKISGARVNTKKHTIVIFNNYTTTKTVGVFSMMTEILA